MAMPCTPWRTTSVGLAEAFSVYAMKAMAPMALASRCDASSSAFAINGRSMLSANKMTAVGLKEPSSKMIDHICGPLMFLIGKTRTLLRFPQVNTWPSPLSLCTAKAPTRRSNRARHRRSNSKEPHPKWHVQASVSH